MNAEALAARVSELAATAERFSREELERFRVNPGRFRHRQVDDVDALCLLCWAANKPLLREEARAILARRHPATRGLPPESLFAAFYAVVTEDYGPQAAGSLVSHGTGSLRGELEEFTKQTDAAVSELHLRCDKADALAREANAKVDDLAKRLAEQEQADEAQWRALYAHREQIEGLTRPAWKRLLVRLWNWPSNS